MQNLTISAHMVAPTAPGLVDRILAADQAGLETAWLTVGGVAPDPFAVLVLAHARGAERINFGTSIVPTFPRHPLAMAQPSESADRQDCVWYWW